MTEGEAKDIILRHVAEKMGHTFTVSDIQAELFQENTHDEIFLILQRIRNTVDPVAEVHIGETSGYIEATELTKIFLAQGGFTAVEQKEKKKRSLKQRKRKLISKVPL